MTYDVTTLLFVAACVGVGGAAVYYLFVPGAGTPKPAARPAKRPRAAPSQQDSQAEQLAALRARVEAPEKPSDEVLALNGEPEIEWAEAELGRAGPTLAERLAQVQEDARAQAEAAKGPSPIAPWDLKGAEPSHESLAEALKASASSASAGAQRPAEPPAATPPSLVQNVEEAPEPPATASRQDASEPEPIGGSDKPSGGAVFLKGVKPRVDFAKEPSAPELARSSPEVAPDQIVGQGHPPEDSVSAIQTRGHLLLVDDSKVVRVKTEKLLLLAGYEVTTAVDGHDALEKLEGALPDIVITDIEMPNLDGFGLIKAMQESARLSGLPVIVMTSHIRLHLDIAATQGVVGFLPKPFDDQDLLDQVSHLLES